VNTPLLYAVIDAYPWLPIGLLVLYLILSLAKP
jgi:hypothetical protein